MRLVPFPAKRSKREFAVITSTPDSPDVGEVSKEIMKAAAKKAFGPKLLRKVHESSPGVWLVRLESQKETKSRADMKLVIGGVEIAAEHIPKIPPRVFIWRPAMDDDIPCHQELTYTILQCFEPLGTAAETQIYKSPRRVIVTFADSPGLLRFHIQINESLEAKFDPLCA